MIYQWNEPGGKAINPTIRGIINQRQQLDGTRHMAIEYS
jgi:ABC-type phosphate transport system substrate-binding protein